MFIPDERFQAIFGEPDKWTLQVKYVQARDEGEYECQISTDPKKSHIIKLNIVGESRGEYRVLSLHVHLLRTVGTETRNNRASTLL